MQAREVRCLRPREGVKPPTRFADVVEVSNTPTYREALEGQDSKNWMDAIQKEYNTLQAMDSWEIVKELPKGEIAIGTKWVLKVKMDPEG